MGAEACNAAFKRKVLLTCIDDLEHQAFTRYRQDRVDWPLGDGFHVSVGLQAKVCADCVEVDPFVGVHAAPLMRMAARLQGRRYDRALATYDAPLGRIAAGERPFQFRPATNIQAESARLARVYATVGLAYAKSLANYATLLPLLHGRVETLGGYPERVACCLLLMDRPDEAHAFAQAFLTREPDYFKGFAAPFLRMLEERR